MWTGLRISSKIQRPTTNKTPLSANMYISTFLLLLATHWKQNINPCPTHTPSSRPSLMENVLQGAQPGSVVLTFRSFSIQASSALFALACGDVKINEPPAKLRNQVWGSLSSCAIWHWGYRVRFCGCSIVFSDERSLPWKQDRTAQLPAWLMLLYVTALNYILWLSNLLAVDYLLKEWVTVFWVNWSPTSFLKTWAKNDFTCLHTYFL